MTTNKATDVPRLDSHLTSDRPEVAGPLGDFDPQQVRTEILRMAEWIADYRATIASRAVSSPVEAGTIAARLDSIDWEAPTSLGQIIADFDRIVMPGIVNWGHPAFFAYFGSTSNTPALLGEMAAAALNVSAMTWASSPAATEMESVVLEWIRDMTGLPPAHTGVVYDTASVAVMHALAAAREAVIGDVRASGLIGRPDLKPARIYASDQAHSSAEKAAIVLGLGESNVVRIETDEHFRMNCESLSRVIDTDKANGYMPMAIVATVGTTSTAAVDPVSRIAEIAAEHGAWLHVDAAYGGAYGILPEGRWVMNGMHLADSIVINPHKWLFVPLDFSALYLKNPKTVRSVFSLTPEYLRGDAAESPSQNYMDFGIQLGRRFRALKAWMVFRAFGRSGIESRVRECCRLANAFAALVTAEPDFQVAAPVSMAIVCFRFTPDGFDLTELNQINENIVERVNASGKAYITHTQLRDTTVMRVGLGNVLTTEEHIAGVWNLVRDEARRAIAE